jgi:hypothetical protein
MFPNFHINLDTKCISALEYVNINSHLKMVKFLDTDTDKHYSFLLRPLLQIKVFFVIPINTWYFISHVILHENMLYSG